jgi:hypothetical protein
MITYDIDNKEFCMKLMLEDFMDEHDVKIKFMNLKRLFYCTHQQVDKVVYNDILDYYRIPPLESKNVEFCIIFDNIAKDSGINDVTDLEKRIDNLYQELLPCT